MQASSYSVSGNNATATLNDFMVPTIVRVNTSPTSDASYKSYAVTFDLSMSGNVDILVAILRENLTIHGPPSNLIGETAIDTKNRLTSTACTSYTYSSIYNPIPGVKPNTHTLICNAPVGNPYKGNVYVFAMIVPKSSYGQTDIAPRGSINVTSDKFTY